MRAEIRARRAARTTEQRGQVAEAIAEQAGYLLRGLSDGMPLLVATYLSLPDEPGTDALIDQAHRDHDALWVPRISAEDELEWVAYRPSTPVQPGRFGVREPQGHAVRPADLLGLDVMFLPGLAVDTAGHRLGQGGGYYDRMLASFPRNDEGGPLLVIVLNDDEVLDDVPVDEWDCSVDVALTPSGIIDLD